MLFEFALRVRFTPYKDQEEDTLEKLSGKVAVVTGVASGIGKALANALAAEGCRLAIADINEDGLRETEHEVSKRGVEVLSRVLDVAQRDQVYEFADQVIETYGAAHLIINNAGVAIGRTVENMTYEDYEWIMGINFWGMVYGTKAFLPHLLKQDEGHIVNVSSVFGFIGVPNQSGYNASKFAIRGFTEALRGEIELSGSNVGVSCVHPGGIKTNIARSARFYPEDGDGVDFDAAVEQFDKAARTTSEKAADVIIKGVKKGKKRILIGWDARLVDWAQRLFPVCYGKVLNLIMGRMAGDSQE